MLDLNRSMRRPAAYVPVMAIATLWLVVQNTLLLAAAHGHAAPAPIVVARALAGIAVKLVTLYPVTALLVAAATALLIYLGFDLVRGREPLDDNS